MNKEEEQWIAVGEIAFADFIDAPIKDLTGSATGLCRSADDGSRTEEFDDEDAARASSEPKPHAGEGSIPESTWGASGTSKVLPELVPPMMHIHIAEKETHQEGQDQGETRCLT